LSFVTLEAELCYSTLSHGYESKALYVAIFMALRHSQICTNYAQNNPQHSDHHSDHFTFFIRGK